MYEIQSLFQTLHQYVQSMDCESLRFVVYVVGGLAFQYVSGLALVLVRYCCSSKVHPRPSYGLLLGGGLFGNRHKQAY